MPRAVRARKIGGLAALIIALPLALLALLTLDLSPAVNPPAPPQAYEVEIARDAARRARQALEAGGGRASISISSEEVRAGLALASRLEDRGLAAAQLKRGRVDVQLSRRLLGPLWVNVHAKVTPEGAGRTAYRLTIGRLPLGQALSNLVLDAGAWWLRRRGGSLPPVNEMVRNLRVSEGGMTADIRFPLRSAVVSNLAGAGRKPVDAVAVAKIYCVLVERYGDARSTPLEYLARTAFTVPTSATSSVEASRAALVALAMAAVGPQAGRLADEAARRVTTCGQLAGRTTLHGRPDLAKHWSLSAALAVTLGNDLSRSLGEWKELADSRPDGSGFSFIDLAADRSGLAAAAAAQNASRAPGFIYAMRDTTEERLLPLGAMAMAEGLAEDQFVARYRTIESAEYAATVQRIDGLLATTRAF